jgi:hypothetical protein
MTAISSLGLTDTSAQNLYGGTAPSAPASNAGTRNPVASAASADEGPAAIVSLSARAQAISQQSDMAMAGNTESSSEIALQLLNTVAGFVGDTGGIEAARRALSNPGSAQQPDNSPTSQAAAEAANPATGPDGTSLPVPGEAIVDQTQYFADGSTGAVNFDPSDFYKMLSISASAPGGIANFTNGWAPAKAQSFVAALNAGTLNIQNAYTVPGLDAHSVTVVDASGQGEAGTFSQNGAAMAANSIVQFSGDGQAFYVTW